MRIIQVKRNAALTFAGGWVIALAGVPAGGQSISQKLPDTGQTVKYTKTHGEDADYSINPPSFTDAGHGTVTDNVTGLMWQKMDAGEMTWEKAAAYADGLTLAGHDDWRLPTARELFGILNHGRNPAMDATYFPRSAAEYWWSSETMAHDASRVWVTNSGGGVGPHPRGETVSAGGPKRFCVKGRGGVRRPGGRPGSDKGQSVNFGQGPNADYQRRRTQDPGRRASVLSRVLDRLQHIC